MDPVSILLLLAIAGMVVLSWPHRRERRFRLELMVAADRERVWSAYHTDLDDPVSAAFHRSTVAARQVSQGPDIEELTMDASGGHGTHFTTVQYQRIEERRPELSVSRNCALNAKAYPYGRDQRETLRLEESEGGGTHLTYEFQGETGTIWQSLALRRGVHKYFNQIKDYCETGQVPGSGSGARSLWISLGLSVLAVGSFAYWLGWLGALLMAGVLVVHEFGHWLAMRMTGQPAPRMLLIPFFGGVAVANHPHKSLFDDAFCSLMGPGFSAVLAIGFMFAAHLMSVDGSPPPLGELAVFGLPYRWFWLVSLILAFLVGLINLFQLLPVLPLDGGHVLRALVQSFHAPAARWILLVMTLAAAVAFVYTGFILFAGILVLGALQAWHMSGQAPKALPMGPGQVAAVVFGYLLFCAVHGTAVYFGARLIGWSPF